MRTRSCLILVFLCQWFSGFGQNSFRIVPLGVKGGVDDANLSAYLVAPGGFDAYVCLDAGSLSQGIRKAVDKGTFKAEPDFVLKNYIRAYFISHPHLDHISGMIINSVEDTAKFVYAFPACLKVIQDHYFNWQSWPNLASEGSSPALKKYTYKTLQPDREEKIPGTEMTVRAFPLSHARPYESAAFLIGSKEKYVLYFGDTGPDEMEQSGKMKSVWEFVAPLVRQGKLAGIFLEVSYPNEQPDTKLYGHLTPRWFMQEMGTLAGLTGPESVRGLNVVVTHIKPTPGSEQKIMTQLKSANSLGLKLIFPQQGEAFDL